MNSFKKTLSFLTAAVAFSAFSVGCSEKAPEKSSSSNISSEVTDDEDNESKTEKNNAADSPDKEKETDSQPSENIAVTAVNYTELFSDRDKSGSYDTFSAEVTFGDKKASISGNGASADGSVVTISEEGIYKITGKSSDGQIVVNAPKAKVQLVLENADITCKTSSALYVMDADKTFVTLAEGSKNTLSDGSGYKFSDEEKQEPDAAIFSEDSLTINGSGALSVNGNFRDGIRCKDDIVITGGNINVTSKADGIKGKDYVAVSDGSITVSSGEDGIKSTNKTDTSLGFVYVSGGSINIKSEQDGIQAETVFRADGGTFNITAGGGSENSTKTHNNDNFGGFGRVPGNKNNKSDAESGSTPKAEQTALTEKKTDTDSSAENTDISTKGIKGLAEVNISGGKFAIDSAEDSVHSNKNVLISGGKLELTSGSQGIKGNSLVEISDGEVNIKKSYEGIESAVIRISGGKTEVKSSDDGLNASDGSPQGAMGNASSGVELDISGGTVYVNADGDGLDSNGDMKISGGTVLVDGPTNDGNGALDGNNEIVVTGGTVIAAGSSGMAEAPGKSSSQYSVSANLGNELEAGTIVTLTDESGKEIISYAPSKKFSHIVISCSEIKSGKTYKLMTGGSSSAKSENGLYKAGGYKNDGEECGSFTADDITSYIGSQGMGGGFGGGHHGMGGKPDGFEPPTNENGEPDMGKRPERPDNFEMPTNENGEPDLNRRPEMPEGFEPPTGENGTPMMPERT